MMTTTHTRTATQLRSALDALQRSMDRILPQSVGLPADFDAWRDNRASALAGILDRAGADQAPVCAHHGAHGVCMPRIVDGRCIWCERTLPVSGGAR